MTILRPINVFKQFRMHVEYLLPTFFQPAFTCPKLTLETPENPLKYVQSYNKDNTVMSMTPFWYLYYSLWTNLTHRFDVSFVEFEQVHAGWDYVISLWWIRQNPYLKEQLDALIFWVCNLHWHRFHQDPILCLLVLVLQSLRLLLLLRIE